MKHLSLRTGLVILLACAALAVGSVSAVAQDAAAVYKAKCAMCHGPDGKGSATGLKMGAHDFTAADVQKETDAQLTDTISKGKGKMRACLTEHTADLSDGCKTSMAEHAAKAKEKEKSGQ